MKAMNRVVLSFVVMLVFAAIVPGTVFAYEVLSCYDEGGAPAYGVYRGYLAECRITGLPTGETDYITTITDHGSSPLLWTDPLSGLIEDLPTNTNDLSYYDLQGIEIFGQTGYAADARGLGERGVINITVSSYLGQVSSYEHFITPYDFPVPEPATLSLLGLGLAGVGFMRRRKAA